MYLLSGALLVSCGDFEESVFKTPDSSAPTPSGYAMSTLVSDGSVNDSMIDRALINPWGIVFAPGSTVWVVNNGTGTATSYDGAGMLQSQLISLPGGSNGAADPTGVVYNATTDFIVSSGTSSAPASLIFDGEGGTLIGWAPALNQSTGVIAYDDGNGHAVYTGLAIAANQGANFLYAADFHNNKIDVFNGSFQKVTVAGGFADSSLPQGYAAFGIQAVTRSGETILFVTYASRAAASDDPMIGAGLGVVNSFDANGTLLSHFVAAGGHLNAPWGIAVAPGDFGSLSDTVLIGNFGDGTINAYDPSTGAFVDSLETSAGAQIATPGLWGIAFGNAAHDQPVTTLFFAAGIANEVSGVYGRIDPAKNTRSSSSQFASQPGSVPTDSTPPSVTITMPGQHASAASTVTVTANATDNVAVASVEFFVNALSIGIVRLPPYSVDWDSTTVGNGTVSIVARATDTGRNVGVSTPITVFVSNVPRAPPH
jgi:uncharacterized protein (TIGR03118 family)